MNEKTDNYSGGTIFLVHTYSTFSHARAHTHTHTRVHGHIGNFALALCFSDNSDLHGDPGGGKNGQEKL